MKKLLISLGITSTIFASLINMHPDAGIRVLLFFIFGALFFGITWGMTHVQSVIEGLIIGGMVGICSGIVVASLTYTISITHEYFIGLKPLLHIARWTIPVLLNALVAFPFDFSQLKNASTPSHP